MRNAITRAVASIQATHTFESEKSVDSRSRLQVIIKWLCHGQSSEEISEGWFTASKQEY